VNSVVGNVIIDTCTLENFVVVDQLGLLGQRYGHRARWTETIQYEVRRGLQAEPSLQSVLDADWLGEPIEIEATPQVLRKIDQIRRGLSGAQDQPTQHLGEAEVIYYLEDHEPDWILLSDDQPAIDLARRRGLNAMDTPQVLSECHAAYEIGCPDAYDLLLKMREAGRGVRVPADHRAVC
jgi:predicted nucleic acid-binding protein